MITIGPSTLMSRGNMFLPATMSVCTQRYGNFSLVSAWVHDPYQVGPRGFVRFFVNGVEVGKGYRSRAKAYRYCAACVTADAHDIRSHRRSRQFVLHGSIAPPLVVAVHTMLGDARDHCSDVTYTIVPDADVPSVSEDDESDCDGEDPRSLVSKKHAVLPNADFCGPEGR